jgi:hypothetical protein
MNINTTMMPMKISQVLNYLRLLEHEIRTEHETYYSLTDSIRRGNLPKRDFDYKECYLTNKEMQNLCKSTKTRQHELFIEWYFTNKKVKQALGWARDYEMRDMDIIGEVRKLDVIDRYVEVS